VNPNCLPLFPLGTVLFPGGLLPLRIFEPRYLELIRDSARLGAGFGVCLILEGSEVGDPALPAALG
jgi:Lon protease-like protein